MTAPAAHPPPASDADRLALQSFVVELGAAMNGAGEPVYAVQQRLSRVTRAYGARDARISAFPTFLMVTMGRGEAATVELTSSLAAAPRLDQIAALDRLLDEAERAAMSPAEGIERLEAIAAMGPRFGAVQTCIGYAVLTIGVTGILHPAPRDVVAAGVLGGLVGLLCSRGRRGSPTEVLLPVLAAFSVAALAALAARYGITGPGLRAIVASLVVFLPGATLTTAVLELAAGQVVAGASRLVAGSVQLALLAFAIVAGVEAADVSPARVFSNSDDTLGPWASAAGVLVFAVGVMVANSAPARSFPGLVVVLYSAWLAQVASNAVIGGYVSAMIGAFVMTGVAHLVSRLPSAMPPSASFLPGYWLLVPGTLGLIGLTELSQAPGTTGTTDLVSTVVSTFAVAVGVLLGTVVLTWADTTGLVRSAHAEVGDLTRRRRPRGSGAGASTRGRGPR